MTCCGDAGGDAIDAGELLVWRVTHANRHTQSCVTGAIRLKTREALFCGHGLFVVGTDDLIKYPVRKYIQPGFVIAKPCYSGKR